jgi:hypothetical protein
MFTLLNAVERARQPGVFAIFLLNRGLISNSLPRRQSLISGIEQGACQMIAHTRAFAQPVVDHAVGRWRERERFSRRENLTGLAGNDLTKPDIPSPRTR